MGHSTVRSTTYLSLVESCDDFPFGPAAEKYYEVYLPGDDQPHGYMLPEIVARMPWTSEFSIQHTRPRKVTVLDASMGKDTAAVVNAAFDKLVTICVERDLFHVLDHRHSEPFAIVGATYGSPVYIERFATSLFGFTTRGAHLVAYVNKLDGMKVWVARRSPHLYTYPGMLDVTVAGGVKATSTPFETIVEEADEEASLPEDLIRRRTRPRGVISHMGVTGRGIPGEQGLVTPDYIYVYDIALPEDVTPKPHDDEVGDFYCMSIEELQKALLNEEFKPDSAAVLVDFLVRYSIIAAENEPDYVEINMRLHRRLPFRVWACQKTGKV